MLNRIPNISQVIDNLTKFVIPGIQFGHTYAGVNFYKTFTPHPLNTKYYSDGINHKLFFQNGIFEEKVNLIRFFRYNKMLEVSGVNDMTNLYYSQVFIPQDAIIFIQGTMLKTTKIEIKNIMKYELK